MLAKQRHECGISGPGARKNRAVSEQRRRKQRFLKKARKNFCELGAWGSGLPLIATFSGD